MQKHPLSSLDIDTIEEEEKQPVKITESKATTPIRLMIDAIFKATNTPSGREYVFRGAGSIQNVENIDVEWFLEKAQGKQCCGGTGRTNAFTLVEE
jgi:hypothetical protein